jgi:hypothetical protein
MNRFGEMTDALDEQFKKATGGLTIGAAVGLYVFALFVLVSIDKLVHDKDSGGIWWAAVVLAFLFWCAYSFGQHRAEEKASKRSPPKSDQDFNLPL